MASTDLEKILSTAFLVPMGDPNDAACSWGLNVMLWGPPGIGKSERIEMAAAMVGLPARVTYVPTCQPEDASGSPFINTSKGIAMLEAILFTIDDYLDVKEITSEKSNAFESFLDNILGLRAEKSPAHLAKKLVKNLVKVARRYGSAFSRIEPMLPGLSDLILDGAGVWFLDEISSARPAVQGGFLGAVLTKRVGGVRLPGAVRVVAAGNPADSAAGGWDMEPPMSNRWCHWNVPVPTNGEWTAWLNEASPKMSNIEAGEERVRDNWALEWAEIRSVITGFMDSGGAILHALPAEGHPARGRAWSSPRTWFNAARAWATCRCLGYDDAFAMQFIEGCVGEAGATALASWVRVSDLPKPIDVLNNGWVIDKKRLDRCVAVYYGITNYVLAQTDPDVRVRLGIKAWNRYKEAMDANLIDLIYTQSKRMVHAGIEPSVSPEVGEAARPVLTRLATSGAHAIASRKK